jgi:hypothetical protein
MPNKETVINTNMMGNILFTNSKMAKKIAIAKILMCSSFPLA